jgi:predicted PurR-regulated permease PerM
MAISVRPNSIPTAWLRALLLPLIVLAWLALMVLVIWLLSHFTRTILIVTLAVVLAFAFTPLANLISRWTPRPLAIGLAYVLGLAVIIGFGAYVSATALSQVGTLITNLPGYTKEAQALQPQVEGLLTPFGLQPGWLSDLAGQIVGQVQSVAGSVASEIIPRLVEFFGAIVDVVLMLILSIYFCSSGSRVARWLKTETPDATRPRARAFVAVINRVVGGYVRGVLILAALIGVLVGVGLAVLGVPYAVLLGVLAFFMEFIPVLGVFISGAAALIVTVLSYRDLIHPLLVLGYFVLVHIIEGDVIGPRIMGRAVGIHPATGLVALVAGTEVFGIWGALFAAPLAGLVQAIITAAWIEFHGGDAGQVLQAAEQETTEPAEEATAVASGG